MATKFQAIQKRLNTNPLNVSQPKPPAQAAAPVVSVSPKAINSKQNFGMWSAEWWMVSPTIATYNNPVVKVRTPKTAFDYSTLDKWWLQDEIARLTFRMKNGSITEDDAVNYNRLTRTLAEQNSATANTMDTSEIERLRAEQEAIKTQRMTADEEALASFKQAQAAQLAQRTAAIQQAGAKQREAAQAATSFSWFGRSTVNAEQQASIEQQIQQSILYENAANDLAIQKYQAELQGASSEVLAGYDQQIAAAQWQASQIRQDAVAEANKLNTEQSAMFGDNLQWLIANKTMAAPKVERIGWTNKSPIYGYWDGTKFVTTNAQWVPTVRSGWGGWGWSASGGWVSTWMQWWSTEDIMTWLSWFTQQVLNGQMKISDVPSASRKIVAEEISKYGATIQSSKAVNGANDIMTQIDEIRNHPWFNSAIWLSSFSWKIPATDAYGARLKIDQLKNQNVIPMLENMRWLGAMSEVEFNAMKTAATALNPNMSEKDFNDELNKIYAKMEQIKARSNIWWSKTTVSSKTTQQTTTPVKTTSTKRASIFN